MLAEPRCWTRHCRHYLGIKTTKPVEDMESPVDGVVNYCQAFPDGIPDQIAYRRNKHLNPIRGQKNNIVFEEGPFEGDEEK